MGLMEVMRRFMANGNKATPKEKPSCIESAMRLTLYLDYAILAFIVKRSFELKKLLKFLSRTISR
jgi:hypothetical protein